MTCHTQLKRKYITDDALEQIDRRNICEAACLGVPDEMLTSGCVAELRAALERLERHAAHACDGPLDELERATLSESCRIARRILSSTKGGE